MPETAVAQATPHEIHKLLVERAQAALNSDSVARDCYLIIEGIDGPHNVGDNVKKAHHVYAFQLPVTNTGVSAGSLKGGGAAFGDLHFISDYNSGSPNLFAYMSQAKDISKATLYFLDQQGGTIGTVTLEPDGDAKVYCSHFNVFKAVSKENRPLVHGAFSFAKITHAVGSNKAGYSVAQGKKS
ncbi:MAG: type VI secretion system tube protein Hcp [Gemmataceae bacterium]